MTKNPVTHPLELPAVLGRLHACTHVRLAHDLRQGQAGAVEVDEGVRRP